MNQKSSEFNHELIMPNEDLPFKLFQFEGKNGNYYRDRHWHRSIEIFAVFEGTLTFILNNEAHILDAGQFIIVNSNEIHAIESPKPNHTVVLQIALKTFENYFTADQFIRFTHDAMAKDTQMMAMIQDMYQAYVDKACGYDMKVRGLYYMLLHLLVTEYRELSVTPDMIKYNKKLNRLSMITGYIKDNYDSDLSLESLAEVFGYAPAYLSRMFQRYAGINYKTYLQSIRVEQAFYDLAHTELTISEVAMNNGFPNSKAFAKAFHKRYGMLPSEYRKVKSTVV